MADVVTRLVVESKEYDSKIARATSGLTQFEKKCREVGGTLEFVEKEDLAFVQALGQMDTVASTATGKLGELKKAFTELSVQYQNLTKAEKQSPYGKALAGSLDQLKGRIKGLEGDLSKAQLDMNGWGDAAKSLGSKLGIPIESLTRLGPAAAAAGVAIKVVGDAFKQNEELMDEWGHVTQSTTALYQGFLNALNTGDISGFINNMKKIVSSARSAYDAMDELGTFNSFNKIQVEQARTGFSEAITNYREGSGSKEDVKAAAEQLKNEMTTRQQKEQDAYVAAIKQLAESRGVDADKLQKVLAGSYGDYEKIKKIEMTGERTRIVGGGRTAHAVKEKYAANEMEQLGEMLRKLGDDELGKIQQLGATAQATKTEISQIDKQVVRVLGGEGKSQKAASSVKVKVPIEPELPEGSIAKLRKQLSEAQKAFELAGDDKGRETAKKQIEELTAQLEKLTGKAQKAAKAVQMVEGPSGYSQAGISALRGEIQGGMKDMQIGSKEYMVEASRLVDLSSFENLLNTAVQAGIEIDPTILEANFEKIDLGVDVSDEEWQTLVDTINAQLKKLGLDPIELDVKTGNVKEAGKEIEQQAQVVGEGWSAVAGAINTVGGALQGIDDPSAKVAGIIAQAVANIALSFAEASASPAVTGTGWGWLGFAAAGIATMISTIASIKQVTAGSYASGGIIPGNSFSGDNQRGILPDGSTIGVNAGELILSKSQQSNLASQLEGNSPMRGLSLTTDISGSNLRIVLNNDNRSKGGSRNFYSKVH